MFQRNELISILGGQHEPVWQLNMGIKRNLPP